MSHFTDEEDILTAEQSSNVGARKVRGLAAAMRVARKKRKKYRPGRKVPGWTPRKEATKTSRRSMLNANEIVSLKKEIEIINDDLNYLFEESPEIAGERMSHFTDEEDILMSEEVGWARPGGIGIPGHTRQRGRVLVEAHERGYPDVWEDRAEYRASLGEAPVTCKVTKMKSWKKGNNICVCAVVECSNGAKLCLATCTPISSIMATMGWNPWGALKKGAKALGKSAKYAGKGLMQVAKSPQFQQLAMQAAPAALTAFGVPPWITQRAMQVVNQGRAGQPQAIAKIANIRSLAQQQYRPAQQLYGVMSSYYRGGVPGVMQAPPQVPRYPAYPTPGPYGYQMQAPAPQYPYGMRIPSGMQRFRIPTPGYGMVSGWLYNVPYRSVLAKKLEISPLDKMRAAYQQGMVGDFV